MKPHALAWCALAILMSAAPVGAESPATATAPATAKAPAESVGSAKDLGELAGKLTPDLLAVPDIARSPFRVTIVLKSLVNKTEDMPGRDMNIYLAKLNSRLSTGDSADRLQFVQERAVAEAMAGAAAVAEAAQRGASGRVVADPRLVPQYSLTGEVHSVTHGAATSYQVSLHLTNLNTGVQVWNGSYELQTLN